MGKVVAYIDGNNLFYGTKCLRIPRLLWCDVKKLVSAYLGNQDSLCAVRYYTAKPSGNAKSRWTSHINALKNSGVEIIEGKFKERDNRVDLDLLLSQNALAGGVSADDLKKVLSDDVLAVYNSNYSKKRFSYKIWLEKETDVHIATDLVGHSYENEYDTAFVMSGDSDLIPAIKYVLENRPNIKIKVIAPPGQRLHEMKSVLVSEYPKRFSTVKIKRAALDKAQLPDEIRLQSGKTIIRPAKYA